MTPQRPGIGVAYTASAYLIWGGLGFYFLALAPTGPFELVAMRILFSLVFCALLILLTRGAWPRLKAILRQPRLLALTALAGVLIYVNWQVFVLGMLTEHVVETSLGYFINPIFTVLLGVLVLHERLRPLQWVAIGLAALAVIVIVVAYGSFPWISLALAASFGTYGLVKNRIGPQVDAVSGLTLETMWLVPVAAVQLIIVALTTGLSFGHNGGWHAFLLAFSGVMTAVPLLLFAAGARRVPLSLVGILQFITPIMQFIAGVFILHEPMPTERWIGFCIVWCAIILFIVDSVRHARRAK